MIILLMLVYSIVNKCAIDDLFCNVLLVPIFIFLIATLFGYFIVVYLNNYKGPVTFPACLIYYLKNKRKETKEEDCIRFKEFYKFYNIAPHNWSYWKNSNGRYNIEHSEYSHVFSIHPKDNRKMKRFISNQIHFERTKEQNKYYTQLLAMVQKDIDEYRAQANKEMKEATERIFKKEQKLEKNSLG